MDGESGRLALTADDDGAVPDDKLATWHPTSRAMWQIDRTPVQLQRLAGIDQHDRPAPDPDPRLQQPGWMRAIWSSQCRACDQRINEREPQALHNVPGHGRTWVHGKCREAEAEA